MSQEIYLNIFKAGSMKTFGKIVDSFLHGRMSRVDSPGSVERLLFPVRIQIDFPVRRIGTFHLTLGIPEPIGKGHPINPCFLSVPVTMIDKLLQLFVAEIIPKRVQIDIKCTIV